MSGVEYVVGSGMPTSAPLPAFDPQVTEFLGELSRQLLRMPEARTYPDITALAFWCRKANLQAMAQKCPERAVRLGRGLCLHIAPGNVPVNFAFSYFFGLLSGCSNLVRLPSRRFPQAELICRAIASLLPNYPEVACRTAFVRYPADDATTAEFSRQADARVIWGGDGTIAALRALSSKPRCVDVCFADRYSLALLSGKAIAEVEEAELRTLAENFYNDTYLMDQNACSSPQLILWTQDDDGGRARFWDAVREVAQKRYPLQASVSVDKYLQLMEDALEREELAGVRRRGNLLYTVELARLPKDLTSLRGKSGYFYEYGLKNWSELAGYVTEKFQTLTYFGVDGERVRQFVLDNCLRGIDRIVPVGKALDIGIMWDGYDLVRTLSRIVDCV